MSSSVGPGTASPVLAGSPALRSLTSRDHSPSPRQRPFPRMPSMQQVNTNVAQTLTTGPTSARSTSSMSHSPYLSSLQCSPMTYQTQALPYHLANPAPLELPESIIGSLTSTGTYIPPAKSEGLVRKLSHGTKKVTSSLRRKASHSNQGRRDASKGPVARRRSDSKTAVGNTYASEPDPSIPDVPEGLGLNYALSSYDDVGALSDVPYTSEYRAEVVAPAVPEELVVGCRLIKATRRKQQEKIFSLDKEGSRVTWSGTVSMKYLYIDDITSIRTGSEAASQWHYLQLKDVDEDKCFIINYAPSESSRDVKTLHLQARSQRHLRLWVDTLEALSKHREEMMSEMTGTERQSVLRAHWESEIAKKPMKDGKTPQEGLDLAAILSLSRKLHIHCSKAVIESAFRKADTVGRGRLDFEQFRGFVGHLRKRVDIKPIFDAVKSTTYEGVTKDGFFDFLRTSQGIDLAKTGAMAYWESRFDSFTTRSDPYVNGREGQRYMDFNAFTSFLLSKDCHVYATPEKQRPVLDRPLNEYFISSSHNTYLTGRQVGGTSSVEAYVTALRHGCRSVEIDCWDGDNDTPRVTHGFTRTTSVNFSDVIAAINRCAFDASPYPVILSLEVHCNSSQQAKMVQIMKDIFGEEKLLMLRLPNHMYDLPSPEELKYKILVKVKATESHPSIPASMEPTALNRQRSTSSPYRRPVPMSSSSSFQHLNNAHSSHFMMSPPDSIYSPTEHSVTATSASSEDDDSDVNSISPVASEQPIRRVKTSKIIPGLAVLGIYCQGYSFRNVSDLGFQQFNHIFSLNENVAANLCSTLESKAAFEDHNVNYLCRVYPKGIRINSSNFDPNTFWRRGVQMVALNWQTFDINMQMGSAMFAAGSDTTGYVLKPDYLRKQRRTFGGFEHRHKLPRWHVSFSVKIISAQQLPLLSSMGKSPSIDPFIEVQMFSAEDKARNIAQGIGGVEMSAPNGYHGIGVPYTRRTKVVRENGYNPQFNDLFELSLETKYPSLVFVRFIVYQAGKNSKQLATFTAKLESLQPGYRHIPLYNNTGEELIFSSLFCQITKGEPTLAPSSLQDLNDHAPRQLLRGMLSRGMSGERGRERGSTLEEQRKAGQHRLNQEIEERKGRTALA